MAGLISMMSVMFGATVAYVAGCFPDNNEALETCAGALMIGGLALLGSAIPVIL